MTKKQKQELNYFINPDTHRITYNIMCRKCVKDCKQSYRSIIVSCPNYKSKRSKKRREGEG